ncbi:immune inhibitor A [Shewanella avicenniae]|uniref:Immune inhibitor A n=1 Tax=Shewanella avicenniae TaxID=2814294 RepID=A0ABX7QQ20_9GAMM|nr:immune inhibitor A domain-containing protein [Shewanella avicenniae]QSX33573.1 immune inhibitor A [Shewanella avicenniae]
MKSRWLIGVATVAMLASSQLYAAAAPADIAIHNKQQILYWLTKRGEIATDASDAEKQAALQRYLSKGITKEMRAQLQREQHLLKAAQSNVQAQQALLSKRSMVAEVTPATERDTTKTVRVLAVLVDFPDLPYNNNQLSPSDTNMYYSSYPTSHYDGLLFSSTGFRGPSGQTLRSAYQYYQSASGGSFSFTGEVIGWVRASQNAAYYGANDPDNDDNDMRAPELVEEAVTAAVSQMTSTELAQYDIEDPYDLDMDGNVNEPDGIIDHVMVFHSSIGEESGGGVLGDDAIWSHRFFVANDATGVGQRISGTNKRLFGYTIQPIDAGIGVCVHEFGHDLGLPDEYDSANDDNGSPVGEWSLMAEGSWTGYLQGSEPSGFSPYARSFLQERYEGKWQYQQSIAYANLTTSGMDYTLYQATEADEINQLAIDLPSENTAFNPPYSGSYQFYSGTGNMTTNEMAFNVTLPNSTPLTLSMKAKWDIEDEYDYAQVIINGAAVAGNYTLANNGTNNALNIITGKSSDLAAADSNGWVTLTFDLSAYAGSNRQIRIVYSTDQSVLGEGMQLDELSLTAGSNTVFSDNAETVNPSITFDGFARIDNTRPGEPHRYLVQLRNYSDIDAGLSDSGYEAGVLIWYENQNVADNEVNEHPGRNLIGVIDADQQLIGTSPTRVQIRDAAFSLFNQSGYPNDTSLLHTSLFDDRDDYSAPAKPAAGLVLPALGVIVEVVSQEQDSSIATVNIRRVTDDTPAAPLALTINSGQNNSVVSFSANVSGGTAPYSYAWNFGDGSASTAAAPTHTYQYAGSYTVSLTVTDSDGATISATRTVTIASFLNVNFTSAANGLAVQFTNTTTSNLQGLSYAWDFGDGSSSSAVSPSHSYAAAGSYTVTLTVTSGNTVSSQASVVTVSTVTTPPTNPPTSSSGSSGGGSLTLWVLAALLITAWMRRYQVSALMASTAAGRKTSATTNGNC